MKDSKNIGTYAVPLLETGTTEPLPIYDTHAHIDLPDFDEDRLELIRLWENGAVLNGMQVKISGIIIPGIDADSCRNVHKIATQSPLLHVAVGIHPNHCAEVTNSDWQTIAEIAGQDDVVGIGETGLDRYWDDVPMDVQIEMFHRHLELSQERDKPILIHCRDAWEDLLPILRQARTISGVIHAFSGNVEQMLECVERGFYISYSGSVTYRNVKFSPLWEAAQKTPIDRLLIETDAPYMTPHPLRGKLTRNDPLFAALTAQRLAELRDVSVQTIAETTAQNALRVFGSL